MGGQETAPPTVASVWNFCKDDGHSCPPSHLSPSPGLCSGMNGGRIGRVHFCPAVDSEKCRACSSLVRMNIMNALEIFTVIV